MWLRGPGLDPVPIRHHEPLELLYRYWTYVIANRLRISEDNRTELQERALRDLLTLGVAREDLARLAGGGIVEVSVPYVRETEGWAARVCPWESVLSLATKPLRKPDQHLTVLRHLRRGDRAPAPAARPPQRVLIVVSAPGRLKSHFDFTSEHELVRCAFLPTVGDENVRRINDPTVDELAEVVQTLEPDVIHLSGIDSHQAAALLRTSGEDKLDGFVLREGTNQPVSIGAEPLARALTAQGKHRPQLVSFNCFNSGSRLAAMAVAHGADSAVGFQDTLDDAVAEQFFTNLYSAWRELGYRSFLNAFGLSRQQITATTQDRNSGDVVLWSAHSIADSSPDDSIDQVARVAARAINSAQPWLKAIAAEFGKLRDAAAAQHLPPPAPATRPTRRRAAPAAPAPAAPVPEPVPPPATPAGPPSTGRAQTLDFGFEVKPLEYLNYSLLHNHRPIFRRFRIIARNSNALPLDLEVKVQLFAGDNSFSVRSSHRITAPLTDLHDHIHLPLIAPMLRGRREGIGTALTSEIYHDGHLLHCDTSPLRLLPADEWTDTEDDRRWLPSFILPRDPAVQRIFESAQRYLRALADDSTANFDGYQPLADLNADSVEVIDVQVRALWCALLYDHPIYYINPPPTYTQDAQRIRSPSQMMEEKRGTCLDLALLFAGCLEYLGLMPVMFLIHGHAFPGYWRRPDAQKTFWEFGNVNPDATAAGTSSGEKVHEGWMVQGDGGLAEITRAIQHGGLVPLETTAITRHGSFREAQELGVRSLMTPWGFDAMLEIQRAREKGVTPLPLLHLDL